MEPRCYVSGSTTALDYVPMDNSLPGRQHASAMTLDSIRTQDSMPEMLSTQGITQGSLPDLPEVPVEYQHQSNFAVSACNPEGSPPSQTVLDNAGTTSKPRVGGPSPKQLLWNRGSDNLRLEQNPLGRGRVAELGTEVSLRSASAGDVRGIVTDSDHEYAKVMFFINSKACFRTVKRDNYLKEFTAVHPSSCALNDSLFPGPIGDSHAAASDHAGPEGNPLRKSKGSSNLVEYNECIRGNSRDTLLRGTAGNGNALIQTERGRSMQNHEDERLTVGSVVSVRSASHGRCVEGIITDMNSDRVRVHYFLNGVSCTKTLPRSITELSVIDRPRMDVSEIL